MKGFADIADDLDARIRRGEYGQGALIPPIRALAEGYGVAPLTIRRAIKVLADKGRVAATPGVGTRVSNACPLETIVVVCDVDLYSQSMMLLHADIMAGVQAAGSAHGARLEIVRKSTAPLLARRDRHGLMIMASCVGDEEARRWMTAAQAAGLPYVHTGVDNGFPNYFRPDAAAASRLAIEYLHRIGHRAIALIPRIALNGQPRFGLVDVEGLPGAAVRLHPFADSSDVAMLKESVRQSLRKALGGSPRATAFFVGMDSAVPLALECLREEGLAVPGDVSVVGYCRQTYGVWSGWRITRVNNPHRQVAAAAAEALIRMAAGGPPCGRVAIAPEFFEGETCAPFDPSRESSRVCVAGPKGECS